MVETKIIICRWIPRGRACSLRSDSYFWVNVLTPDQRIETFMASLSALVMLALS